MAWKAPKYLTPDSPDNDSPLTVRTIFLPSEPEQLQALIDGAISTLFESNSFLKKGNMTEEETAQFYRDLNIMVMSFCEALIDCLANDEDTREALIQAMIAELLADPVQAEAWVGAMRQLGLGATGSNTQIGSPNSELGIKLFGDCEDPDVLYGKCYAWIDALNTIAEDVLQWVEVFTNDEELATMLMDNIPALGSIPASIGEFSAWLQETVAETYLSAFDTTTHEYWACAIYCEVDEGSCELTIENVHNGFANKLTSFDPPNFTDGLDVWLAWYVDLVTLDDTEIVGAMMFFIMNILERTGEIFGSNWRTVTIPLETAEPITPLCEDCAEWCKKFDFTEGQFDFQIDFGTYVPGVGFKPEQWTGSGNRYNGISIYLDISPDLAFTSIEMEFTSTVNQNSTNRNNYIRTLLDGVQVETEAELAVTHTDPYSIIEDDPDTIDRSEFVVYAGSKTGTGIFSPGNEGDCTLISVTFRGEGLTNPFGTNNC